jgi:MFS family permease
MIMGVGMFLMSFPVGKLADRFGRKNLILLGALVTAGAIILIAHTTNVILLAVLFFFIGLGFLAVNGVAPTIVADVTHPLERGKATGIFGVAVGLSAGIFPMIAAWGYGKGMAALGFIGAGLMCVIILLALPLRERTPGIYDNKGARPADVPK